MHTRFGSGKCENRALYYRFKMSYFKTEYIFCSISFAYLFVSIVTVIVMASRHWQDFSLPSLSHSEKCICGELCFYHIHILILAQFLKFLSIAECIYISIDISTI